MNCYNGGRPATHRAPNGRFFCSGDAQRVGLDHHDLIPAVEQRMAETKAKLEAEDLAKRVGFTIEKGTLCGAKHHSAVGLTRCLLPAGHLSSHNFGNTVGGISGLTDEARDTMVDLIRGDATDLTQFGHFIHAVSTILASKAEDKGYRGGEDDRPGGELYTFVQRFFGEGHPLGEIVYKAVRAKSKGDPVDLVKIAAWAYLVWARGQDARPGEPDPVKPEPLGVVGNPHRMTFVEFQLDAVATIQHSPKDWPGGLAAYHALGIGEEAGEVLGEIKKALRDYRDLRDPAVARSIVTEIGDVLWYLAALCSDLGYNLEEAARFNIGKRARRQAAGTIKGRGDR